MNEAYQIVTPPGMRDLMDEHGIKFRATEHSIYTVGQQDVRVQNSAHSRRLLAAGKFDHDAVKRITRTRLVGFSER